MKKRNNEDPIGKYVLIKSEISVRCGVAFFTIKKDAEISILEENKTGDVLISYGDSNFAWKHISILKDFRRIK